MDQKFYKLGRELQVGDQVEVAWATGTRTCDCWVGELLEIKHPYPTVRVGVFSCWTSEGEGQTEMTIDPSHRFRYFGGTGGAWSTSVDGPVYEPD